MDMTPLTLIAICAIVYVVAYAAIIVIRDLR
jgi:hypothetical protein